MSTAPAPASIVTGVDFVTIPAQDLGDSVRFYGTVLGLPFVKRWGEMPAAEFQAGNLTIAVMDPTAFGQEFRPHAVPVAFARWNSLFELRPAPRAPRRRRVPRLRCLGGRLHRFRSNPGRNRAASLPDSRQCERPEDPGRSPPEARR
jgi:catechol 2,3-dioxygenase-like lactoylglutathione lyase family enzyme